MKLESSFEWFASLQCTVTRKVNETVVMEAIDDRGRCRGF
jgi:hypothetical protein